jgi:hypothetical protein
MGLLDDFLTGAVNTADDIADNLDQNMFGTSNEDLYKQDMENAKPTRREWEDAVIKAKERAKALNSDPDYSEAEPIREKYNKLRERAKRHTNSNNNFKHYYEVDDIGTKEYDNITKYRDAIDRANEAREDAHIMAMDPNKPNGSVYKKYDDEVNELSRGLPSGGEEGIYENHQIRKYTRSLGRPLKEGEEVIMSEGKPTLVTWDTPPTEEERRKAMESGIPTREKPSWVADAREFMANEKDNK